MRILGWFGMALVVVGGLMLVAPGVARFVLRYGLGMKTERLFASRAAAWGLVVLGLFVTFMTRLL